MLPEFANKNENVPDNVKFSLDLIKHHALKTYGGSGGTAPPFLYSALDGDGGSVSRPVRFDLGKQPLVPTVQEARWVRQPVWTSWTR
jgi:hypothetical protein